jgi:hypothetical protein
VVDEWVNQKIKIILVKLEYYLRDCRVELGPREWTTYKGRGTRDIVSIERLCHKFGNDFSANFLKDYYGDWHSAKVTEVTEKMMNNFQY